MTSTAKNGADILVLLNLGTEAAPDWQAVACQRDFTLDESADPIDASCKDSTQSEFLAGRYSATLTLDALYIENAAVDYAKLKTAIRNRETLKLRIQDTGDNLEEADAIMTGLSTQFPDQDVALYTADFQIAGPWSAVA